MECDALYAIGVCSHNIRTFIETQRDIVTVLSLLVTLSRTISFGYYGWLGPSIIPLWLAVWYFCLAIKAQEHCAKYNFPDGQHCSQYWCKLWTHFSNLPSRKQYYYNNILFLCQLKIGTLFRVVGDSVSTATSPKITPVFFPKVFHFWHACTNTPVWPSSSCLCGGSISAW